MSALTRWRARLARTRLRAPLVRLRHLGLDSNDVFLASYPRSGNTMLRFMLGEALSGVPSNFDQIQRIIPEIGVHVHAYPLGPGDGRLIKTHELYRGQYRRAVYIVRDVRDVMLSSFAREIALDVVHIRTLGDYVRPFMQGKMTRFGSWQEHVDGWMNSPLAKKGDLLVVRFEEMRRDLEGTVSRCLEFLGKKVDPSVIRAAVRNNSLEKMRAKEDQAKTLPKSPGEEGRWVGKGAIHGWREKLTEPQLEIIDEFAGDLLERLGYAKGANHRLGDAPKQERTMQQRPEIPRVETAEATTTRASVPHDSGARAQAEYRPLANRTLGIRLGGWTASLFSWYRY